MTLRFFFRLALLLMPFALPAQAQDAADMVVRLNRLEGQVRQLSGQIEQLQFENKRLTDQLKRFQEDTEFRLSGQGGARPAPAAPPPNKRSDAFDPATRPPVGGGPGLAPRPRPLGQTTPSSGVASVQGGVIDDEEGGPLDLSGVARPVPQAPLQPGPRVGPSVAATTSSSPREEFDAAYGYILRKDYPQAEMGFRQFLQSYPRDRQAPDATYWLGESYFQRGRHREAAETFLKVSTDYPRGAKAADSLLRLGMSLNALGARDQACATYAKIQRDYPQASTGVRQGVEREQKKARCA